MRSRLAIVTLALGAMLVPSSAPAWAPDTYEDQPSLHAVPFGTRLSRAATTQLELYVPWHAGELARVAFFVPSGYRIDLESPPGTDVGLVVAWTEGFGRIGKITAAAPAAHIADLCAPGLHQAVWLLELKVGEEARTVPLFVDRTVGGDVSLGQYMVQACFPRSMDLGMRIAMLELDLDRLTNPHRAGAYTWRAFVTPYGAEGPDPGRTFELRSTVPLPMRLTLRGRYDRTTRRAVLTGRFISPAFDVEGIPVELFVKMDGYFEPLRWTRAGRGGRYSFRRRIRGRTTFAAATGAIAECRAGSPAPAGCVSETLAGVASAEVTVRSRR